MDITKVFSRAVVLSALTVLLLGLTAAIALERYLYEVKAEQVLRRAEAVARAVNQQVSRNISSAYSLAALIRQTKGNIANFDSLAQELIALTPSISSLQLAPHGVIQQIYPQAGNEKAIGHNLLTDEKRNKEARLAVETRQLSIAGPFDLKQGGTAFIGRLPVFLGQRNEDFWGFAIVLTKLPAFLERTKFQELEKEGYSFELWRTHPDSGQKDVFARSGSDLIHHPVDISIEIPNGKWHLSLSPKDAWGNLYRVAAEILIATFLALVTGRNVYTRRRSQAAMEEKDARFQKLYTATPALMHSIDRNGNIIAVSDLWLKTMGYQRDEVIGRKSSEFLTEESRCYAIETVLPEYVKTGSCVDVPYQFVTKEGHIRDMLLSATSERDAEGNIISSLVILDDVTHEKEMATRLQAVFDTAADGIHILDDEGNLIDFSPSFALMLGYTPQEAAYLNLSDWEAEIPQQELIIGLKEAKQQRTFETRHRRKDGSIYHAEVTIKEIVLDGKSYWYASAHDISERKQAEQLLAIERQRFSDFSSSTADWFWEMDGDLRFSFFSDNFEDVYGLPKQDVLGKTQLELLAEDQLDPQPLLDAHIERLQQHLPFRDFEYQIRDETGQIRWISISGIPIQDTKDRFAGYRGVGRVATEYKHAEQALHDSELRFRLLTGSIKDYAIIMLSPDGQVLTWNEGARRLKGYASEEIIGRPISLFFPAEEKASGKPLALLEEAKRNVAVEDQGWRVRKDGSRFYADVILTAIHDASGALIGFAKVTRDISDRRKAEEALRESRDRLEAAASAGIVGIWDWDIVDNRLAWDSVMYKLYGIREEDWGGAYEAWASAIHPEDKAYTEGEIQAALRGEHEYAPEFRIIWPDGSIHHIKAASHTTYDAQGKPLRMIGVNYDLTEQKKIEHALVEAKEKAESANQSKSDFLANMSHEIRTPMNAVMGLAQLLLDTELTMRQRDFLSKMNTSARSLLGILNDILDYSKIEAGKLDLESVDFEVAEILENTAGLFNLSAENKGLELVFDVAPDIPPVLIGDPLRFKQIINNLIGNAIKFTQQGHVRLSMVPLDRLDDDLTLKVAVCDTGIGMTAEQVGKLFHAFEQADTSTTRKFGGTGLGLTIAKALIEMMEGDISVASELGKGSIFTFTLRFKISETPTKLRTAASLRGMRTLIVDDQEIACDVMKTLVSAWSFEADIAHSGDQGLGMALDAMQHGNPYELVLLDWRLPGIDGIELARRLREEEAKFDTDKRHAIVVMVTAYGRKDAQRAIQEVKFDAILDKPVIASQLFDLVANLQGDGLDTGSLQQWSDLQQGRSRMQAIRRASILLVEDNPINQMVAREMLEKLGLRISIANNGREAVELASAKRYDAILMDLQMPEMDGIEASKRIRALPYGKEVPIIAMTAAALLADRQASQAAGMNDFVAKPIDIAELTAVLLRWILLKKDIELESSELMPRLPKGVPFEMAGLALTEAVLRMGGNWNLLRRTLDGFARDFADSATELDAYLADSRWANAQRLLHTIKGMSKSIGANDLHAHAERLEQALTSNQYASPEPFKAELTKTIAAIGALPPLESTPAVQIGAERMTTILTDIQSSLKRSRFVAPELLDELGQGLADLAPQALYRKLKGQIDTLDYETATLTLAELTALCQADLGV